MKFFYTLLCAILVVCFFGSCQKDDLNETQNNQMGNTNSLIVSVVNENDTPISGVTVTTNGQTSISNQLGIALFTNITTVDGEILNVNATKTGFADGFANVEINRNQCETKMILIESSVSEFQSSENYTYYHPNGYGKIVFAANSFATQNGVAYSGEVKIKAAYTGPGQDSFINGFPGSDFKGINANGDQRLLQVYGAFNVKLEDEQGNSLQIIEPATIHFTIPQGIFTLPSQISMWHFNEDEGKWREEGEAFLQGGEYVGQVNHFSWWSASNSQQITTYVEGNLINCQGYGASGIELHVVMINSLIEQSVAIIVVYTDENGYFKVDIGELYGFAIFINSNKFDYFEGFEITSNNPISIGDINQSNLCNYEPVTFQVVGCSGEPITGSYYCDSGNCITDFTPLNNNQNIIEVELPSTGTLAIESINGHTEYFDYDLESGMTDLGIITICDDCINLDCGPNAINCNDGTCICSQAYTGELCDQLLPEWVACEGINCFNGEHELDSDGDCFCECEYGYEGEFCQNINPEYQACLDKDCTNGTISFPFYEYLGYDGPFHFLPEYLCECVCEDGWYGPNCNDTQLPELVGTYTAYGDTYEIENVSVSYVANNPDYNYEISTLPFSYWDPTFECEHSGGSNSSLFFNISNVNSLESTQNTIYTDDDYELECSLYRKQNGRLQIVVGVLPLNQGCTNSRTNSIFLEKN